MLLLFSSRSAPEESVKWWVISDEWWVMSFEFWVMSDISPCREMFYKSSWFSRTVIARKRSDRGNPEDRSTSDCTRVILRLCRRISRKGKPCRLNITPSSMAKCWTLSFEFWVLSVEWYISLAGDVFRHFILTFHVSKSIKPRPAVQNSRRGYFYE